MSGSVELSRLVDSPRYSVTISDDDLLGILDITEECLMRLDDFIDLAYGKYLRDGTREKLELRRQDARALLARLDGLKEQSGSFPFDETSADEYDHPDEQYHWLDCFHVVRRNHQNAMLYHSGMLIGEVYQMGTNWFHAWMQLRNDEGLPTMEDALNDLIYAYARWNYPEHAWS